MKLKTLTPYQERILKLRIIEGKEFSEIAKIVNEPNVKNISSVFDSIKEKWKIPKLVDLLTEAYQVYLDEQKDNKTKEI